MIYVAVYQDMTSKEFDRLDEALRTNPIEVHEFETRSDLECFCNPIEKE